MSNTDDRYKYQSQYPEFNQETEQFKRQSFIDDDKKQETDAQQFSRANTGQNPYQSPNSNPYQNQRQNAPSYQPPVYDSNNYYDEEPGYKKPRKIPFALVLLLFLTVAFSLIYFFVPENMGGLPAILRMPGKLVAGLISPKAVPKEPTLIRFERVESEFLGANEVRFRFVSESAIEGVMLEDENTNLYQGTADRETNDGKSWLLTVDFTEGVQGKVYALFMQNGTFYKDQEKPLILNIAAAAVEPEPIYTQPPINLLENNGQVVTPDLSNTGTSDVYNDDGTVDVAANSVDDETIVDIDDTIDDTANLDNDNDGEGSTPVGAMLSPVNPSFSFEALDSTSPSKLKIQDLAYKNGRKQTKLELSNVIDMPIGESYTSYDGGVFTFRGDNFRQNAAFGELKQVPTSLSVVWERELGGLQLPNSTVYGLGWTGQPAIIKWAKRIRESSNIVDDKKTKIDEITGKNDPLKEVIVAAQDGKVYFVDLEDGKDTREQIKVGFPIKSSVSVDSQGRPMLAFGQTASQLKGKSGVAGTYIYNLLDQKRLYLLEGRSNKNQKPYSSNSTFDGTALFTGGTSDSLVVGGENGLFYVVELNTDFDYSDPEKMTLKLKPTVYYQKSKGVQKNADTSIETSPAMYAGYAFVADRHGIVRAIDVNTLTTLWAFDAGDNTDASPALDIGKDGKLALYTGSTVFTRQKAKKTAVIRRLDATSGEEVWQYTADAKYLNDEKAGVKASPIVGHNDIEDYVIFTINHGDDSAHIVALNKADGKEAWNVKLTSGAISSPVAVYTEDGASYIIQGTDKGHLIMLKGATGEMVTSLNLGGKIEGSPAVYNDMLVIGTASKGAKLFGIKIQ